MGVVKSLSTIKDSSREEFSVSVRSSKAVGRLKVAASKSIYSRNMLDQVYGGLVQASTNNSGALAIPSSCRHATANVIDIASSHYGQGKSKRRCGKKQSEILKKQGDWLGKKHSLGTASSSSYAAKGYLQAEKNHLLYQNFLKQHKDQGKKIGLALDIGKIKQTNTQLNSPNEKVKQMCVSLQNTHRGEQPSIDISLAKKKKTSVKKKKGNQFVNVKSFNEQESELGRPISMFKHQKKESIGIGYSHKVSLASPNIRESKQHQEDLNDSCEELRNFPIRPSDLNSLEDQDEQVYIRSSLNQSKSEHSSEGNLEMDEGKRAYGVRVTIQAANYQTVAKKGEPIGKKYYRNSERKKWTELAAAKSYQHQKVTGPMGGRSQKRLTQPRSDFSKMIVGAVGKDRWPKIENRPQMKSFQEKSEQKQEIEEEKLIQDNPQKISSFLSTPRLPQKAPNNSTYIKYQTQRLNTKAKSQASSLSQHKTSLGLKVSHKSPKVFQLDGVKLEQKIKEETMGDTSNNIITIFSKLEPKKKAEPKQSHGQTMIVLKKKFSKDKSEAPKGIIEERDDDCLNIQVNNAFEEGAEERVRTSLDDAILKEALEADNFNSMAEQSQESSLCNEMHRKESEDGSNDAVNTQCLIEVQNQASSVTSNKSTLYGKLAEQNLVLSEQYSQGETMEMVQPFQKSQPIYEIEEIIMNAKLEENCNIFDNPKAARPKNTLSSVESAVSFVNDMIAPSSNLDEDPCLSEF